MSNILYALDKENFNNINASLLYVTKSRYEEDWHSTLHTHPFTELFYVLKGKGSFIVKDKSFPVEVDDLVIVNGNVPHTELSMDSNPLEYIVLGIEGMSILNASQEEEEYNYGEYSIQNYKGYKDEVLFYLKKLLNEVASRDKYYKEVSQNLLHLLIINIIRRTEMKLVISSTKKLNKESAYIKNYIDIHYATNITLDSLAALTYMNKYYMVHAFKRCFGTSPINYLIDKRINEAKILLETTNYSIAQISDMVGFSNQSYFCQAFKRTLKVSPNSFRKGIGKQNDL